MSIKFYKNFLLIYLIVLDVCAKNMAHLVNFLKKFGRLENMALRMLQLKEKRTTELLRMSRNDPNKIQRFNFIREFLINDV